MINNMDNWIDVLCNALKDHIKIISLTYDGQRELWFKWDDMLHNHD